MKIYTKLDAVCVPERHDDEADEADALVPGGLLLLRLYHKRQLSIAAR